MQKQILSSIDRKKLYKRIFEPDSIKETNIEGQTDMEDFYEPLAKILALIYETEGSN